MSLFDVDEERAARSRAMNAWIVGQRDARQTVGTLGRTGTTGPIDPIHRERLCEALTDLEAAQRGGDELEIAAADARVDACCNEARAAREGRKQEQPRNEDGTFASFDGGVRGGGGWQGGANVRAARNESSTQMFARAVARSKEESRERAEERPISDLTAQQQHRQPTKEQPRP